MKLVPLKYLAALSVRHTRSAPAPLLTLDAVEGGTGGVIGSLWSEPSQPPSTGVADVERGDVLFGKLRPYLAKVTLAPQSAYASTELLCLRPKEGVEPRWLLYRMLSRPVLDWAVATSEGTKMPRTSWDRLGSLTVPVPDQAAQRAIADLLDAETARIDALIRKKQRLAESLETHLYTKIEAEILKLARGAVPLRRLLQQPGQYGASESGEEGEEDWPRYIRITDLAPDGSLRPDNVKRLAPVIARPFILAHGDLLFARSGATTGKAFRYQLPMGPAAFAGYLIRFRFDSTRILPELVDLWTRTRHYGDQIGESTVQATIQNVSADRYASLMVPIVPVDQQPRLVDELVGARRSHSEACGGLAQQIALLRERRQALITAAVTGELDLVEAG